MVMYRACGCSVGGGGGGIAVCWEKHWHYIEAFRNLSKPFADLGTALWGRSRDHTLSKGKLQSQTAVRIESVSWRFRGERLSPETTLLIHLYTHMHISTSLEKYCAATTTIISCPCVGSRVQYRS